MDLEKLLAEGNAVVSGDHFVYKSGKHGHEYIDKGQFSHIGSINLVMVIKEIGWRAEEKGLKINLAPEIGIIGPAEGAVLFPLSLAEHFEQRIRKTSEGELFKSIKFFPAKTSVNENDRHYVKDKDLPRYRGKPFIIFEDIVNDGTTIREVGDLIRSELNSEVIAAMCFVDRGGQTAESLNVPQYFPGLRVTMEQHKHSCCPLCKEGIPINTKLGKGKRWVELFGQPPYKLNTDFSPFWFLKN